MSSQASHQEQEACKIDHVKYCFEVLSAQLKGTTLPRYDGSDKDKEL